MRPKDVILKYCVPKENLETVIDTLLVFSEIFEHRDKGEVDRAIEKSMWTLGFSPFYKVHGITLRPIYLESTSQSELKPVDYFLSRAIPTSLTIALPNTQHLYGGIREKVLQSLKE